MRTNPTITKMLLIFLYMTALVVPGAHSAVITFDGLAGTDMPGMYHNYGTYTRFVQNTSTVEGFNFYSQDHYYIGAAKWPDDDFHFTYNGTDFLATYSPMTISASSGNPFTLNSMDFGSWYDIPGDAAYIAGKDIVVTGTFYGGGSNLSQTVTLDNTYNQDDMDGSDFNHFTFSGFTNLSSLIIGASVGQYQYFTVDNLEVDVAPVPEPATMLLLGSGLIGLAGMGRKKFKKNSTETNIFQGPVKKGGYENILT